MLVWCEKVSAIAPRKRNEGTTKIKCTALPHTQIICTHRERSDGFYYAIYHLFNVSIILSQYQFLPASAWHINFYVSECARTFPNRSSTTFKYFAFDTMCCKHASSVPILIHGNWLVWWNMFNVHAFFFFFFFSFYFQTNIERDDERASECEWKSEKGRARI